MSAARPDRAPGRAAETRRAAVAARVAMLAWLGVSAGCAAVDEELRDPGGGVQVEIRGNQGVSTDSLLGEAREEFRSFREHRRAADLDDAAWAMEQELFDEGYAHGKVELELRPSHEEVREAVFHVDEGPRTWFGEVRFSGNAAIGADELRRYFMFPGSGLLGSGRELFVRSRADAAVRQVEREYLLKGYYRVKVPRATISWREEDTVADVEVAIEEGRRWEVASIDVEGLEALGPRAEIEEHLRGLVGGPYHVRVGAQAASFVRLALEGEGRLLAKVTSETKLDEGAAKAAIVLHPEPGPKLRVAKISTSGQDRTEPDFIKAQAGLVPGEILTKPRADVAVENLYRTGLFSNVELERTPHEATGEDEWDTDVELQVKEVEARTVDFELGWGSYELARGAVRYRDRNLFGIGRDLEAEVTASLRSYGAEVRLLDPYLLGPDDLVQAAAGFQFRQRPSFDTSIIHAELSDRHRFDPRTTLTAGYRFRSSNATEVVAGLDQDEEAERAVTSGPFAALELDRRDNVLLPRSGWIANLGVSWSSPVFLADLDFVELTAGYARYDELWDGVVLATGFKATTREILDGEDTLPIQERLFLGGEDSVRSFYEAELGPTDADGDPLGGLTAFDAHAELRVRVAGNFHVAPFYDIGTVGRESFQFGGPYGHAIGLGLRYYLPVGPIRLDFGWNPGRTFANDQNWALHFSFGFSF